MLAVLCGLFVYMWVDGCVADEDEQVEREPAQRGSPSEQFEGYQPTDDAEAPGLEADLETEDETERDRGADRPQPEGGAAADGERTSESTRQAGDRPESERSGTEGAVASDDREETDQRRDRSDGIGPDRWMAEPDDVDREAIEDQHAEGRMERDFELAKRADRRTSIEKAEEVLGQCRRRLDLPEPTTDARVAVSWRLRTEGGTGVIEEPAVLHWRGPETPRLEDCFAEQMNDHRFEATGDGVDMQVRWVEPVP